MLGVVIANGDKQLVIDLPASLASMQAELASIEITTPIESIPLSNEEGAQIRVKVYARAMPYYRMVLHVCSDVFMEKSKRKPAPRVFSQSGQSIFSVLSGPKYSLIGIELQNGANP